MGVQINDGLQYHEPQWWFIVEGIGMAHKATSPKSQLNFLDNNKVSPSDQHAFKKLL